uniref:Clarin-3 n=1 Tax=Lygus hesperus TaxID=30085 RepID=A0A0K8S9F7_LYGHE
MNLYKNGMIFGTFLGSCLCIGLLAASLGTRYWIVSTAAIVNRTESDGKVFYGLFNGEKNLNFGIGWRTYELNVPQEMSALMVYSYWLGTVCCMAAGIVFSSLSAVLAVVNSATTPIWTITGVPGLYLWNIVSIIFQSGAVALWVTLYFRKLQFSIMTSDDRWSTEGRAFFGLSFWLVVASIGVQIINVIFIYSATSDMRQKKKAAKPVIEEKTNGAIMLY